VAVSAVERIERVSLTAADSVGTEEFYVGVLGFRRIAVEMRSGPACPIPRTAPETIPGSSIWQS
jgi:hypothetical protein